MLRSVVVEHPLLQSPGRGRSAEVVAAAHAKGNAQRSVGVGRRRRLPMMRKVGLAVVMVVMGKEMTTDSLT